jgi:hypothetical protein
MELQRPQADADRTSGGGFSALSYDAAAGSGRARLQLLSDLPAGRLHSVEISGGALPTPADWASAQSLSLATGRVLDGEAMVLADGQLWLASEGRRSAERRAQLLRLDARNGTVLQEVELPQDWQAGPGQGLPSNGGPESLSRLSPPGKPLTLLMAAEHPLLQDPADRVRLLRWWWPRGRDQRRDAPQAAEQGSLRLPPGLDWGLTDLLVLPQGNREQRQEAPLVLALLRQFLPPQRWNNRLALYALPAPGQVSDPLQDWDLQAIGLTPENWEGLSRGPAVDAQHIGLLLVSDDNLNPLQSSRLALLALPTTALCQHR